MTDRTTIARLLLGALAGLALAVPGRAQDELETRLHSTGGMLVPAPSTMLDHRHEAAFLPIGLYRSEVQLMSDGDTLEYDGAQNTSSELAELLDSLFPLPEGGPDHVIVDLGEKIRVTGTPDLQRRVAAAIDAIAGLRDRQVELSVRQITLRGAALDDSTRALLIRAASARLTDADLARLDDLDAHRGARSGTLDAPAGIWTMFERTSFREHLADFDVEIAQDSSIADPIVHRAPEGARAAVRAFPTEDGRVLLRVAASCGDVVSPMRRLNLNGSGLGTLELPDLSGSLQSTDLLVRPGETVGIVSGAMLGGGDARWDVLLLRVIGVSGASRRETLQRLPLGALASQDPLRLVGFDAEAENRAPGWVTRDADDLVRVADEELEDQLNVVNAAALEEGRAIHYYTRSSGALAVIMHGSTQHLDAVRTRLLDLEKSELRSALVTIRIDGADGTLGLLCSRVVLGRPTGLACHREMAYVQDAGVEVAEKAQISDPIVGLGRGGLMANVHVQPAPGGAFELSLDLRLDAISEGPREIVHSAEFVSQVEAIAVGSRRYAGRMRLEAGNTRTLDLGGSPFDPEHGGKLRLLVTVDPQE